MEEIKNFFDGDEAVLIDYMAWTMIVLALVTAVSLQFARATYGRYSSESMIPCINGKVAWVLQELPSFCVPAYCIYATQCKFCNDAPNIVLLSLFLVHYFQRAFIFPMLIKGGKPTPIHVFLMALAFCLYNGYLQGRSHTSFMQYPSSWTSQPNFIVGVLLFVIGMCMNIHSDHVLRNLRKPGESGYKIPKGGMFEYVSGGNFLGEILEWSGYALASWSLPALAFAIFTACNIGPRAMQHHKWYLEKFRDDYPKKRKALIPFIL